MKSTTVTLTIRWIFILLGALIITLIIYLQLNNYSPAKTEISNITNQIQLPQNISDTLNIITWNIGYAGLGKEMDFFYDGGNQVFPSSYNQSNYQKNILKILSNLSSFTDVFLLQEIDFNSKRTAFIDQTELLKTALPNYNYTSTINYNVGFIPFPLYNPIGKVKAGMITFSKHPIISSTRYAYPNSHYWPKSLLFLNRCALLSQIQINNSTISLINLHNSAYATNKNKLQKEQSVLNDIIEKELSKGNYVIAGGDWNMNPPGFSLPKENKWLMDTTSNVINRTLFPKKSQWIFDNETPSNRSLKTPYIKGHTNTTVIDFFLTSPNIKLLKCETINLDFSCSDHQPVLITFLLNTK